MNEQANKTLSLSSDTASISVHFTDPDLTNTGHTASVVDASASGATDGILPGALGHAELMAFFNINSVAKASGSSNGTINATFSAPDLAFDYLAAGETVGITYTLRVDDHAGGVTNQTVVVTVIGSNDKPVYLCASESAHLTEGEHLSPAGQLTATGDFLFSDVDLSDGHTVSTSASASVSDGSMVPLTNAQLLAALMTDVRHSTGHLLGDVSWNFTIDNDDISFLHVGGP